VVIGDGPQGNEVGELLDKLFGALAQASGGKVTKEELAARLQEEPKFRKWRIRKVTHATEERYWIAANPALRVGRIFPRTMPDGSGGHAAALQYITSQAGT